MRNKPAMAAPMTISGMLERVIATAPAAAMTAILPTASVRVKRQRAPKEVSWPRECNMIAQAQKWAHSATRPITIIVR